MNALDIVKAGAGAATYTAPITLYANQTNSIAVGTANFSGVIGDGGGNFGLALKGSGVATLSGNNTFGGGLTVLGGLQVTLSGSNSYNGVTLVTGNSSKLIVNNGYGLGSTVGSTVVTNAGLVSLPNGITVSGETLYLSGSGDNYGALQAATSATSTWAGPIYISDMGPRIGAQNNGVLTISGTIANGAAGNTFNISGFNGTGKVILSGTNTYTGGTGIIRGWLVLGATDALPTNSTVTLNVANITGDSSTFDLAGFNQTLGGLSGAAVGQPMMVTNTAGGASTLTLNQINNTSYAGSIGGAVALLKTGAGALSLLGTNTYTGATTINGGTLLLGTTSAVGAASTLSAGNNSAALGTTAALDQTFVDWAAAKVSGSLPVVAMGANSANPVTFSGTLAETFLGGVGTVTNTGGAAWSDATVRLGGGSGTLVYALVVDSGTNVLIGPVGGNAASVVRLSGANNHPSTTLQSGTLQVSSDGNLGAVPGTTMATNLIFNGGSLMGMAVNLQLDDKRGIAIGTNGATFSTPNGNILRINGPISDLPGQVGAVVVTNAGVLVLGGNNTYSGGTLVPSGANLVIFGNSSMGTGLLTLDGGLVRASSSAASTSYVSNNVLVNADSTLGSTSGKNLTFLGSLTLANGTRTLTVGSTDSNTFAGVIGDGGNGYGLVKAGAGTFIMANVNTYGGGTILSGGTLALGVNHALGAGALTLNGGTLRASGGARTLTNNLQVNAVAGNILDTAGGDLTLTNGSISGTGALTKNSGGNLYLGGNGAGYSGAFTNAGGSTWFATDTAGSTGASWTLSSGTLAIYSDYVGAGKTLQLGSLSGASGTVLRAGGFLTSTNTFAIGALGQSTLFHGAIQDSPNVGTRAALSKLGTGTLTLTGINTYSGGTTLGAGTLALAGDSSLGSGNVSIASSGVLDTTGLTAGGLAVLSGQTLLNGGSVAGGLIINSGASVSGGGSFAGAVSNLAGGTLTPGIGGDTNFFQSLTLAGGSTNLFWIGSATTHDMSVVSNSLDYTGSGMPQLKLDLSGYTWNSGDTFQLYNNLFAGLSAFDGTNRFFQLTDAFGAVSNLYNNALFSAVTGGGSATNLFRINYDFNSGDGQSNDLLLMAIPEPASVNLLVMLGAAYWLRRRLHRPRRF